MSTTVAINYFRKNHLANLLQAFTEDTCPIDAFLAKYFRAHASIGAKDRKFISDTTYGIIRWLGLIEYCHEQEIPVSWESRIETFLRIDPLSYQTDPLIPAHIKVSCPPLFYALLVKSLGEKKAMEFCWISNFPAPTTIRINPAKTTREALIASWKDLYNISPTIHSPWGITFHEKIHFFSLPAFKEGLFEVQDEASQLVADLIEAKPGDIVLDYCSGSGGKTLAFAHKLKGKGQIYLHDIRAHILREAKKRLARAGIQNAQLLHDDVAKKNKLYKKVDWVLVDAPCSGTGTLRRNPDAKWKFIPEDLDALITLQQQIFTEAIRFLKPGGHIVYATCSVLKEENEKQVEHFLDLFSLELVAPIFQSYPSQNGMDGFFGAVLRQKSLNSTTQ